MGMKKFRPWVRSAGSEAYLDTVTATTLPDSSRRGPPLLPGLTAVSLWMNRYPARVRLAEITPRVRVP